IFDLRPDASLPEIAAHVEEMKVSGLNAMFTRAAFKYMLLKRAHSKESFRQMAAETAFKTCVIREESIGLEVALTKEAGAGIHPGSAGAARQEGAGVSRS